MVAYYHVGPQAVGHDTVALTEFGGEVGDPIGAALRVDGWPRVNVLRARNFSSAGESAYERYQDAVRELALTFDFEGRRGPVDIVWKPAWEGSAQRYDVPGEPVDRIV